VFKKLIIKLVGLDDISDIIYSAREQERKRTLHEMGVRMRQQKEAMERQYSLELQSKQAEISLLEKKIKQSEQYEKEIKDLEYKAKKQIKENFRVSTELAVSIKDFTMSINSIFGEIMGIQNTAENHQKKIQE
jgi:hypothetical protein